MALSPFFGEAPPETDLNRVPLTNTAVRLFVGVVGAVWLVAGAIACGKPGIEKQPIEEPMFEKTIEEVLREHTNDLMSVPGVVGTGQGECDGKPCIRVFVVENIPELLSQIPSSLEGYAVDVEETGEIKALDSY